MVNIYKPEFDESREQDGFYCQRARIGWQIGGQRLGVSLWELPQSQSAYPYHYHLTEEEMILVLEGSPSLRTPDGWRQLEKGEAVSFLAGKIGCHQITNFSEQIVRFLSISTDGEPDMVIYPDSGKLGANERLPSGGGLRKMFRLSDAVDYWEGEQLPKRGEHNSGK